MSSSVSPTTTPLDSVKQTQTNSQEEPAAVLSNRGNKLTGPENPGSKRPRIWSDKVETTANDATDTDLQVTLFLFICYLYDMICYYYCYFIEFRKNVPSNCQI